MFAQPAMEEAAAELPLQITDVDGSTWHRAREALGVGATSTVYKALDEHGTVAAMKCISLQCGSREAADLETELKHICAVRHESIVGYISCAVEGAHLVLLMEYVAGGTLAELTRSFQKLPLPLVRRYALDVLAGLSYLHSIGIVHGDVKPSNTFATVEGGCKIGDFGSSHALSSALGESVADVSKTRGTAWYMAPEVACGHNPSPASDVWSFGVTMVEVATGRLPWRAAQNALKRSTREQQFIGDLAKGAAELDASCFAGEALLELIASRCLCADPSRRSTADALLLELTEV